MIHLVYPRQNSVFTDTIYKNTTQNFITLSGTGENREKAGTIFTIFIYVSIYLLRSIANLFSFTL